MTTALLAIAAIIYIALASLMCLQESKRRKINLYVAISLCLLITPFFAYFIFGILPARNPKTCKWCSNRENEAEYCGICGKNEAGELNRNVN